MSATGGTISNEGEIEIVHAQDDDKFPMTIQNAKVNCPILSVKYFTNKDCRVLFRKGGGVIAYPDGKRIPFIERLGVFFVALNVLPPKTQEHIAACVAKHERIVADLESSGFAGQGVKA